MAPAANTAHSRIPSSAVDGANESTLHPTINGYSYPSTLPFRDANASAKAPGAILTGKQEHYLKRELISEQTQWEINELNSPTALRRFGAPFRSDAGEVPPEDSELPLLRYIFVHHVRNFPFLDQAREKEFWQDKLQVVCICLPSQRFDKD